MQKEERDDRERNEEQACVEALGRQPWNQQRQQQQGSEGKGQIDPPPLRLRIKSVDELAELRLHKRPASADGVSGIFCKSRRGILSSPDLIHQREPRRGKD